MIQLDSELGSRLILKTIFHWKKKLKIKLGVFSISQHSYKAKPKTTKEDINLNKREKSLEKCQYHTRHGFWDLPPFIQFGH